MIERGDIFRSGALATLIPPAPAEALAQTSNKGGPLNIRHIRRGLATGVLTGRSADKTITSETFDDVDYETTLTVSTSERPLLIEARLMAVAVTGTLYVTFSVNGSPVGGSNGLCRVSTDDQMLSPMWILTPGQGTHRISLVAKVSPTDSGTIYCVGDVVVLTAREV